MNVARHIHDMFGCQLDELSNELFVTSSSRRVDDDSGLISRELDLAKDVFGVTGEELGVGDVVEFGVLGGVLDGIRMRFRRRDFAEERGEAKTE